MWGLGFQPPKNADMLLIGGNIQADKTTPVFSSGNTRIGGTGANTYVAAKQNQETHMNRYHAAWEYENQSNPRILTGLGKTSALKGDMTGNGDMVDYNNYVNRILKPLSSELTIKPTTGNITFSKAADVKNFTVMANSTADIRNEGWITFTGDGQNHPQKFELDVNTVEATKTRLNILQWSLDFRNVGDSQPIIINVTGRTSYTWNTGWRIMVNGVDSTTHVNADANNGLESLQRFKRIASRIMWNYPSMTSLTLDSAHIYGESDGKDKFRWGRAVLFPGSILLPAGSMHDIADTNGRLLVGKNLILDIWEHHNAPWIGMPDTPQCFTIEGETTATIS